MKMKKEKMGIPLMNISENPENELNPKNLTKASRIILIPNINNINNLGVNHRLINLCETTALFLLMFTGLEEASNKEIKIPLINAKQRTK